MSRLSEGRTICTLPVPQVNLFGSTQLGEEHSVNDQTTANLDTAAKLQPDNIPTGTTLALESSPCAFCLKESLSAVQTAQAAGYSFDDKELTCTGAT